MDAHDRGFPARTTRNAIMGNSAFSRAFNRGIATIAPFLVVACGMQDSDTPTAVRTDSAGIEIVVSSRHERPLDWRFERLWSVGGSEDEGVLLSSLAEDQIVAGPSGQLYVLDAFARHVLVLSSAGAVVDTLGREGGGPGELRDPFAISSMSDGGIAVFDYGHGGFVRWSRDGQAVGTVRMESIPWGTKVAITSTGTLMTSRRPAGGGGHMETLIVQGATETHTLAEMAMPSDRVADFPSCGLRQVTVPPLFAPTLHWDTRSDRLAVVSGVTYEIDVYHLADHLAGESETGPALTQRLRRPILPRTATERLARQAVSEGWDVGPCTIPPEEVVRGRGFAEEIPVLESLRFSPDGKLWTLRGQDGDGRQRIDIFESDGEYLGTLSQDTRFPAEFIDDDRFVTIETDSLDVPRITAYRIVR